MRSLQELKNRLQQYRDVEYLYFDGVGYIAWHISTGENIETLFIEATPGCGAWLYKKMAEHILETGKEPYHSVFCFRLGSNVKAQKFYDKMGWTQVDLGQSIYKDDTTVLMWITWSNLLINLRVLNERDQ